MFVMSEDVTANWALIFCPFFFIKKKGFLEVIKNLMWSVNNAPTLSILVS